MPSGNGAFQIVLRVGRNAQRFQNRFLGISGGNVQPSEDVPILRLDFPQGRRFIEGLVVG
jgi:hypothetical protein